MNSKELKKFERIFKGVANHWRLKILFCINDNNQINLKDLTEKIKGQYQTISEHVRVLEHSGLIYKKYKGRFILHSISPYGTSILKFIKIF